MSRVFRLFIVFLVALPLWVKASDSSNWVRVQLDSFSTIELPVIPEILDSSEERILACADSFGYYAAVVSKVPPNFAKDTSAGGITELYKGLVIRVLEQNGGELINERSITAIGRPAYEFAYSVSSEGNAQGRLRRFILIEDRLYSFDLWYSPGSAGKLQDIRKHFFDSFQWEDNRAEIDFSVLTILKQSLMVLIFGFAGIIIMVWLIVRRNRRKIPRRRKA